MTTHILTPGTTTERYDPFRPVWRFGHFAHSLAVKKELINFEKHSKIG
jgi:hypothetical protein